MPQENHSLDSENQLEHFNEDCSAGFSQWHQVADGGQCIARWGVTSLPGCAAVAVSHDAWVSPKERDKGIGQQQHEERIKYARSCGAKVMICTVRRDNVRQRHILAKHQWRCALVFPGNDCTIELWFRDLTEHTPIQSI
jgi:hypothetical protein